MEDYLSPDYITKKRNEVLMKVLSIVGMNGIEYGKFLYFHQIMELKPEFEKITPAIKCYYKVCELPSINKLNSNKHGCINLLKQILKIHGYYLKRFSYRRNKMTSSKYRIVRIRSDNESIKPEEHYMYV